MEQSLLGIQKIGGTNFLTWSVSRCEPPVNSYLPPTSGSSNPSPQYGPPGFGGSGASSVPGRSGGPSNQYGPPSFDQNQRPGSSSFGGSNQGGIGQNQGPAKYQFSYEVDDEQTGTKFGHSEQRDGDLATGEYNVLLPDGRKQVVEYEADLEGYKPQIRYEDSASGQGGRQGFPQGGTNGFTGGDSHNGFRPQNSSPARYQEASSFGSADAGQGYPRGGPGGSDANGSGGNGFGSSGFGSSGPGSVNGRGGQNPSQSGPNGGYPSGGPQNGGSFTQGSPQTGDSNRYSNGSPQSGGSFTQSSPHSGGSSGYPSGGSKNGEGFSNGGEEGYPSGGPNGVRGSGY
ncbi:hypothetical protein K1T71_008849 [Dendrolimus kikuchii]|uniref:Uncharacterized protein n=1 Tax=Dendrolimus kikuchii TaxID=765133 RepID=A0ACC1CVV6_9NEOP|nr:hypothetical protein K1T71_008849 [Dendrolimus kikuchii]